jgi:hypothetical protein
MRSFRAAASEGESNGHARGLAIQSASTHWTLTAAEHTGDPAEAIDLAVDGATLYLLRPGIGIVTHAFTPDPFACA